jgi:putative copper export protein
MAIAGMLMGWLLIGGHFTLRDPYTAMLTGKITLFIVALLLAALNRMRLGPALRAGTTLAVRRFSMSLAAELVILLAVVGLTATLTSLFSPPMLSAP